MIKWSTIESKKIIKGSIFEYFQVKRQSPLSKEVGTFDIIKCANWVNWLHLE